MIPDIPEWRFKMLASLGIHFSKFKNHIFNELPEQRGSHPILYKNILFTNQYPKAKVLKAFINLLERKPNQIISFDDNEKVLYAIGKMCKEQNIPFTGYHYVQARLQKKLLQYNHALQQLNHLIKYKKWD